MIINQFLQVGTISSNGEREIGELIAKAMEKVGKEGVIAISVSLFFNFPAVPSFLFRVFFALLLEGFEGMFFLYHASVDACLTSN